METFFLTFLLRYFQMCWVESNTKITLSFLVNIFLGKKQSSNNASKVSLEGPHSLADKCN